MILRLPYFPFLSENFFGKLIVQIIGVIAMVLTILCYQLKKRDRILIMQYTGNALWVIHYFLLGTFTGLIMNALNVVRGLIYASDKRWARSIVWVFVFSAASIAFGVITYEAWYSVLPVVGTVTATIALRISDENTLRKVYVFSVPPWVAYNVIVHSVPGAISSIFTLISIVVALIRYNGFTKNREQ